MKKFVAFSLTAGLTVFFLNIAQANEGIVNFGQCLAESKKGKQQQTSFEALRKQMSTLVEDTEKKLKEVTAKLNDAEFMDGISPEAEEELKNKFRTLNEELDQQRNRLYQVHHQANMEVMQEMEVFVQQSAENVAKAK